MTKGKRILLFGFGFGIGCIAVYFMLFRDSDRTQWLPENRVKEQVKNSKLVFSDYAKCMMSCRSITEEEVNFILKNGDVNFGASDIRETVCPSYAFDGTTSGGINVRVVCTACDSIAHVTTAIKMDQPADTCKCR